RPGSGAAVQRGEPLRQPVAGDEHVAALLDAAAAREVDIAAAARDRRPVLPVDLRRGENAGMGGGHDPASGPVTTGRSGSVIHSLQ
ncbi:hypothetical protein DF186_18655, partial [Enterococcus hirae]